MINNKGGGVLLWIIIFGVMIGLVVIVSILFGKDDSNIINSFNESSEVVNVTDTLPNSSTESLINDTMVQGKSGKSSTTTTPQDMPIAGGGGGGGVESLINSTVSQSNESLPLESNESIPIDENVEMQTFSSLEELFNSDNPLGNMVSLHGIALPISGVNTSEYFFFTDDSKVMNNINYIFFNKPDYHITIYNSIHVSVSQGIIDLTGTIVNCRQYNDGTYCVDADTIG